MHSEQSKKVTVILIQIKEILHKNNYLAKEIISICQDKVLLTVQINRHMLLQNIQIYVLCQELCFFLKKNVLQYFLRHLKIKLYHR